MPMPFQPLGHPPRQRFAALVLALAAGWSGLAAGDPAPLTEAQLRARFLVNFARFTEWPDKTFASADAPLRVCVLGPIDVLEGALVALEGATAGPHRIEFRTGVATEQSADCHLLYAPDSELRHLQDVRDVIGRRAILVVGESEAALDRGGMIALRTVDRHLSFVVKLGTARDTNLNFSPQMLRAAAEVLP